MTDNRQPRIVTPAAPDSPAQIAPTFEDSTTRHWTLIDPPMGDPLGGPPVYANRHQRRAAKSHGRKKR